ncbi:MAG: methyltransferase domain-containing protein [Nitrospirae bacterium]|nr:methyltransferase domain-containing protein [Nitrospirota bacterium]
MNEFTYLDNLNGAYAESRILHAAVELNIFDTIGENRISVQEISERLKTNERATELFLNALTALNLLHKKDNLFSLTDLAKKYLVTTSETCYTGMIRFESSMWSVWGELVKAVRTGKPIRPPDMYQTKREETECFIMAMHHLVSARGDADYIADKLSAEGVRSILDIGSGPGTYPVAICKKNPDIKATLFDLPGTLGITRKVLAKEGIGEQIRLMAGDYNKDPLPQGFDVVFLSNIIHGEDEEANKTLLKKIYGSLNPGGRVIIKDHIMNGDLTRPAWGAIFSICMLLTTKGRDYGYHEVHQWLKEAGFVDITLEELPPPMTSAMVLGRKEFPGILGN